MRQRKGTPLKALLSHTLTNPLAKATRLMVQLQARSADTLKGHSAAPARAFLVSRSYLEIAQEACRDVMGTEMRAEDALRLALEMCRADRASWVFPEPFKLEGVNHVPPQL